MAKKVAAKYKAASTNIDRGYATHGSFKHDSRNKPGIKTMTRGEMDKNREAGVHARVRKISKALFKKRMMMSEHSQFNA